MLLLAASGTALSVTIMLMMLLRPIAIATSLVDLPGGRKAHNGSIPLVGGVAMYIGIVAGILLLPEPDASAWYLIAACGVLVCTGLLDDIREVIPVVRLAAQVFATGIMIFGGKVILTDIGNPLGLGVLYLGSMSALFTILVSCTVINAFNFVDGVDGLAASLAVVAIGGVIVVSGDEISAMAAVGLVACMSVLGFLIFNFPARWNLSVRSFMGDSGSTMLGLMVVWVTTSVSQGEMRLISPVIGLWFAILPLADFFTSFLRRVGRGQSPMRPDQGHLHYVLLRHGLSDGAVLKIMVSLALCYALLGVAGHHFGIPDPIMFAGWSVLMLSQQTLFRFIGRVAASAGKTAVSSKPGNVHWGGDSPRKDDNPV